MPEVFRSSLVLFASSVAISLLSTASLAMARSHEPKTPSDAQSPPVEDGPPTLKTFAPALYPEEGRRQNQGGVVTLRLHVDATGSVSQVEIQRALGPAFDEAASSAARRLQFHPARKAGRNVASDLLFEYRFTPMGHTHSTPTPETAANVAPGLTLDIASVDSVTVVESVAEERPLSAASARTVRDRDLTLRPISKPADLFRVSPGLLTVQHAGGGKANQYLLRGFDADHGTDVAFNLDGLPLNMVSHGHGQGYADPNWIIPELIERVEIAKGPYDVQRGDFATAGAVDLITRDRGESFVGFGGGRFDSTRAVALAAPSLGSDWHPLFAAEVVRTNGPFQNPEKFRKLNLYGKLTYDIDARSKIAFTATTYAGSWNASGQIPSRAVAAGALDFFGSLDPTEGGTSSRDNMAVNYRLRPDKDSEFSALAYLSRYDFSLYSNFTFFSADPVNGDQINQRDSRSIAGARISHRWLRQWRGILFDSMVGGDARTDHIDNALDRTRARERLDRVVDADIDESAIGVYAKEEVQLARWLRLVGGLRVDHYVFAVTDGLEDLAQQGAATSGSRGASRLSPKATAIVSPTANTNLFANFGYGFHSNDARGIVRAVDPVTPLTQTIGYEVGARSRLWGGRFDLAAALWGIDIDSETVWVGDEGTTEASGATRRLGAELEARAEILPWLAADLDVTWSTAKFRENAGNGGAVALAPRVTLSGGLSAQHKSGLRAALRGLHIAERPATEDEFLTAEATTLIDLFAAYRWKAWELSLSIENLLNRRYKSAQFATTTRLANEAPTSAPPPAGACPAKTRATTDEASGSFRGCEDVSFSPGNPITLQGMLKYFF